MRLFKLGAGTLGATLVVAACGMDISTTTPSTDGNDAGLPNTDGGDPSKDGGSTAPPPGATYSIGGTVTGLEGTGLVLQDNNGDDLAIGADGAFTFSKKLATGATYAVSIKTQPSAPSQTCTVNGDTGTVGAGDITSVAVNCATNKYTIGGTVSGLLGTVVLQNNGGDDLTVNANAGTFAFATPMDPGATYAVTVKTQPSSPSQTCTLTEDTGAVAEANVKNVALTCVTNDFKVKAKVTGLAGTGLDLQDNGGDDLLVAADGTYDFATTVASGQPYEVTVKTQPTGPSQTCAVTNGASLMGGDDVTIDVTCVTNKFTIGGTISGLTVSGLVLQNNAGDDIDVAANATSFEFATSIDSGANYAVTVKTQPAGSMSCGVSNGTGTLGDADVTNVSITCMTCGTNDVAFNGKCYYLDGSTGTCDAGYERAPQSVLSSIAKSFIGLNYKHTVSENCCIWNADADEDWGFGTQCNAPGPFTQAPFLGGAGCTDQFNHDPAQLTLCGTP